MDQEDKNASRRTETEQEVNENDSVDYEENEIIDWLERITGVPVPLDSVAMLRMGWMDKTGKMLITPQKLRELMQDTTPIPPGHYDYLFDMSLNGNLAPENKGDDATSTDKEKKRLNK